MRIRVPNPALAPLVFALATAGCAPTTPLWTGGSTTPDARQDFATGGAVRVPTGALRDRAQAGTSPPGPRLDAEHLAWNHEGPAPVAMARYGLPRGYDLGLAWLGSVAALDIRREFVPEEDITRPAFVVSARPMLGPSIDALGDARGLAGGFDMSGLYTTEFGGVYDLWLGPALGVGGARTPRAGSDGRDGSLRLGLGGVLGLGAGFRRVHVLVEVRGDYEAHRSGDIPGGFRHGFVVTPSFGLRVRR